MRNAEAQDADAASVLNAARAFLRWRKTQAPLVLGSIRFVDAPESILAFVREHEGHRLLVAFNLSDARVEWQAPGSVAPLAAPGAAAAALHDGVLHFPPRGAAYATLR